MNVDSTQLPIGNDGFVERSILDVSAIEVAGSLRTGERINLLNRSRSTAAIMRGAGAPSVLYAPQFEDFVDRKATLLSRGRRRLSDEHDEWQPVGAGTNDREIHDHNALLNGFHWPGKCSADSAYFPQGCVVSWESGGVRHEIEVTRTITVDGIDICSNGVRAAFDGHLDSTFDDVAWTAKAK
eukprot:1888198-Amphidinium_carterae.1